jgi:hypothetical protein
MKMKIKKRCVNCVEYSRCRETYASWIFFIIGLIATFSLRVVTLLMHLDPIYGKIAWYVGVGGFFLFFLYQYRVNNTRAELISRRDFTDRVMNQEKLDREDYETIASILCSLRSNKDRINYIFIFVLSAAALLLAFYLDFIRG